MTVALAALSALLFQEAAEAFPPYRESFFAAYPEAASSRIADLSSNRFHCGVCHYSFNGGGPRNPYGLAVQALSSKSAAAIRSIGGLDSDGDGFTNDEEILGLVALLNAPTFPGLTPENVNRISRVDPGEVRDFLVPAPATMYDERRDGDLSDDPANPSALALQAGETSFVASQQGDSSGRDVDYVTVTVPEGFVLSAVVLDDFASDSGNLAFVGLQAGSVFDVDATAAEASDLLGGAVFGAEDVGLDLLERIASLPGAEGFTPPLPSGDYTFWLNQTGPRATAALVLVTQPVEEPVPEFLRGDCNRDGVVDVSDPSALLASLFLGAPEPGCGDACDSNDDGAADISDAIATLGVLFLGGTEIPPPGITDCGVDPTDDELDCVTPPEICE